MRVNIWIRRDNEYFWDNLPNKSEWINYMIEQYIDAAKEQEKMKGTHEEPMV